MGFGFRVLGVQGARLSTLTDLFYLTFILLA